MNMHYQLDKHTVQLANRQSGADTHQQIMQIHPSGGLSVSQTERAANELFEAAAN